MIATTINAKYNFILKSITPDFKQNGFSKKGASFYKETPWMRFKVPFHKSRSSTSKLIIFSFHVEAFIKKLDIYYRSKNPIPVAMDYEFALFADGLAKQKEEKYWSIANDSEVEPILTEIRQLLRGVQEYCDSDKFGSLEGIEKMLKTSISTCPISECMRLYAFYHATGNNEACNSFYNSLEQRFKDDDVALLIARNSLSRIKAEEANRTP